MMNDLNFSITIPLNGLHEQITDSIFFSYSSILTVSQWTRNSTAQSSQIEFIPTELVSFSAEKQ